MPLWFKVLERVHPTRVIACVRLFLSVLTPSCFWALSQPGVPLRPVLLIGGLLVGICDSPESMSQHMLIGWSALTLTLTLTVNLTRTRT